MALHVSYMIWTPFSQVDSELRRIQIMCKRLRIERSHQTVRGYFQIVRGRTQIVRGSQNRVWRHPKRAMSPLNRVWSQLARGAHNRPMRGGTKMR